MGWYLPCILKVIGFVGGSLRSQSCIVSSCSLGNKGGFHSGVAKWDFRTQGGQVSRVLIKGLNADTASASQWGGHNSYNPDSVQYFICIIHTYMTRFIGLLYMGSFKDNWYKKNNFIYNHVHLVKSLRYVRKKIKIALDLYLIGFSRGEEEKVKYSKTLYQILLNWI